MRSATDYDDMSIDGVPVWQHDWISTGDKVDVVDPLYGQVYSFEQFDIVTPDKQIRFAAGEFSNTVWGFYVPQENST